MYPYRLDYDSRETEGPEARDQAAERERGPAELQFVPLDAPAGAQFDSGAPTARRAEGHRAGRDLFGQRENRATYPGAPWPIAPREPGRLPEWLPASPPEDMPARPVRPAGAAKKPFGPGALFGCVGKPTYIWLQNGSGFWFYPTYSGKRSVSGYRWTPLGWTYTGVILGWIDFFQSV